MLPLCYAQLTLIVIICQDYTNFIGLRWTMCPTFWKTQIIRGTTGHLAFCYSGCMASNSCALTAATTLWFFSVQPETVIIPIVCSIIIFPIVVLATICLLRHYNERARAKDRFRSDVGCSILFLVSNWWRHEQQSPNLSKFPKTRRAKRQLTLCHKTHQVLVTLHLTIWNWVSLSSIKLVSK